MKRPTEAERAAIIEYGERLAARMEELCISQEKLAVAIGKSQKTVSRYLNGENQSLPPAKVQEKIEHYLHGQAHFICEHMSPEQFASVMRKTMEAYGISQAELSEWIEIHAPTRKKMDQRMLSMCINGTVHLSAWDQYIIRCEMDHLHEERIKEKKYAMRYGEKLSAALKELAIDPKEFAKRLSVPPDLVERWKRGEETHISFVQMEEIPRFLEEKSVWKGYRHLPADAFGRLLSSLLSGIPDMTPESFAKLSRRPEETIVRYLSGDVPTSTEEQWKILESCYREFRRQAYPLPFPKLDEWIAGLRENEDIFR